MHWRQFFRCCECIEEMDLQEFSLFEKKWMELLGKVGCVVIRYELKMRYFEELFRKSMSKVGGAMSLNLR